MHGDTIAMKVQTLLRGAGLTVGSATTAGFLAALREESGWDLERRLIVRPFPQPFAGRPPDRAQWMMLRQELARLSGVIIFVGGRKLQDGNVIIADGVIQEADAGETAGAFLLPIGATGGAAKEIAERLIGSTLPASGEMAIRPSDVELRALADPHHDAAKLVKITVGILGRILKS